MAFISTTTCAGDTKTMQAVNSKGTGKSAGTKRAIDGSGSESPSKYQKIKATTVEDAVMPEQVKEPVETRAGDPDQVFRFMDLPGELRNRVYGMAVEWSYRCFPMTYQNPKKSRHRKQNSDDKDRRTAVKPLPYIGLTQVCSLIRTEFRPLWLSTHRFPLFVLESYFKAFFPVLRRSSQMGGKSRKRIESYHDPAGTLRLWVNQDYIRDIDVFPLLRFHLRFPAYTMDIMCAQLETKAPLTKFFTALINNASLTWVKYIKQQSITQVVLNAEFYTGQPLRAALHVVIKQRQMSDWVEPGGHFMAPLCTDLRRSLGIEDLNCHVDFGIDYW
ncbi:hypothetical protein AA0113_g9927 [Alternaria arborescens]|uniref:F-box domain-containing protein n=1 Tax=Alternaria arborescens TaxID=156630 RepID=A0A4V1X1C3_9PLEO|nr:hypothetical protein AA0112_g10090 [Alternaria arborescens]RYO48488.1 hypothetical protein AA0113_g9927 [Alternaria arborescens]